MNRRVRPLLLAALAVLALLPASLVGLDGDRRPPKRHERCMAPFSGWLVLDGVVRDSASGALKVRLDRGESGVGRIAGERFRFDSTCHVYRASGRWLPQRPLTVWLKLRPEIAFSTRTGSGPRVGDRVAITLSLVARADARGIKAGRMRALDVLGRG